MNRLRIESLAPRYLDGADELRHLVGWNQLMEDWRHLLAMEPGGCFAALQDDEVVGTVTTISYGRALAWVGMMLVHPAHRRRGIGALLMDRAIGYLRSMGVLCVKLDATPAGQPLYEKLGFVAESTLQRWQRIGEGAAFSPPGPTEGVRDLRPADWPLVEALDTRSFGLARPRLIESLALRARKILVWPENGPVAGWGLLRPGALAGYLGPVACSNNEGAYAIVSALLAEAGPLPVFWDIPDRNLEAQSAARRLGFAAQRPLTRMRLGVDPISSPLEVPFAIADLSVG